MYKLRKGNIVVSVFNEYDKENYIKAGWKLVDDEKVEQPKVEKPIVINEPKEDKPVKEKTILMNKKSKYDRK